MCSRLCPSHGAVGLEGHSFGVTSTCLSRHYSQPSRDISRRVSWMGRRGMASDSTQPSTRVCGGTSARRLPSDNQGPMTNIQTCGRGRGHRVPKAQMVPKTSSSHCIVPGWRAALGRRGSRRGGLARGRCQLRGRGQDVRERVTRGVGQE